jgi:hypothetical protein
MDATLKRLLEKPVTSRLLISAGAIDTIDSNSRNWYNNFRKRYNLDNLVWPLILNLKLQEPISALATADAIVAANEGV